MNVINESTPGSRIGSSIGSGISKTLDMLTNRKLAHLDERHQLENAHRARQQESRAFESLGLPQHIAHGLSGLQDPRLKKSVFESLSSLGNNISAPDQTAQGLQQLGFNEQEASGIASLPLKLQQEVVKRKLMEPGNQAYAQALQGVLGNNQTNTPIESLNPQQATKLAELGLKQKSEAARERRYQQDRDFQETKLALGETKEGRKEIQKEAKGAKEGIHRLERMEKLNNEDKLVTATYQEALRSLGLDIPALLNPQSEEFQKLSQDFLRDAKDIFGGRVTNYEASAFLKAIPTLSNSKDGRKRIINNLKTFFKGKVIKDDIRRDLTNKFRGKPPIDLLDRIEEEAAPKTEQLYKKMDLLGGQNIIGKSKGLPQANDPRFWDTKTGTPTTKRIRNPKTGEVMISNGKEWSVV
jgi:hypothetical protein